MKRKPLPWAEYELASLEDLEALEPLWEWGRLQRPIKAARTGQDLLDMFLQLGGATMLTVFHCLTSLKCVSRSFMTRQMYKCVACQFKDMVCAVHVTLNRVTITQPSRFDPPLLIYGRRKFDGYDDSEPDTREDENSISGSDDPLDTYRYEPKQSRQNVEMQCFPQQKTKKHSKKGICPKHIKHRCFTRPCEYSHSWNGTVAVLIQQKRQREAETERRQERRQRRERRHQR